MSTNTSRIVWFPSLSTSAGFTLLVLSGFLFLTAGCAESPELDQLSGEELRRVSDRDLCEAYYYGRSEKVRGELNRRGLIPETDWRRVQRNRVRPGMRECSLLAAWGAPNNIIARTRADVDKVFVYDRKDRRTEVYVSDRRVERIREIEP